MRVTPKALNLPTEGPARGRVFTFYSYKGGTGRSMAMVNVAWMLALNGQRVLVVDWDLEAPGLHRYFHPFLKDKELIRTEGLLDFVEKQAARAAVAKDFEKQAREGKKQVPPTGGKPVTGTVVRVQALSVSGIQFGGHATADENQEAKTQEPGPTFAFEKDPGFDETAIFDYLVPLSWPNGAQWQQFGARARIDLLPAGRQGPAYGRTMSAFNWIDFFERLDGRAIIRNAREQLRKVYDYILIDSRTGVSDTSGICTVEMPDTLVVCFTLNDQSIFGASGIAESVLAQRAALRAASAVANPAASIVRFWSRSVIEPR